MLTNSLTLVNKFVKWLTNSSTLTNLFLSRTDQYRCPFTELGRVHINLCLVVINKNLFRQYRIIDAAAFINFILVMKIKIRRDCDENVKTTDLDIHSPKNALSKYCQ